MKGVENTEAEAVQKDIDKSLEELQVLVQKKWTDACGREMSTLLEAYASELHKIENKADGMMSGEDS